MQDKNRNPLHAGIQAMQYLCDCYVKPHKLNNQAWNVFETDNRCEQCNNKHV